MAMSHNDPRNRDETSGRYLQSIHPGHVLALFNEIRCPAITSSDVTKAYDVSGETARSKLHELWINANVGKRRSGRANLYWRINEWDEADDPDDIAELHSGTIHLYGPEYDFPVWYSIQSRQESEDGDVILTIDPCSRLGVDGGRDEPMYSSESLSTKGMAEYRVYAQKVNFSDGESFVKVGAKKAREHPSNGKV
jgi:hypothetical protein